MTLLLALDLLGVFVFGLSGGLRAVEQRFDVFGVVVLALVTGLGGGLARDVLVGDVPPAALRDERYLVAAVLAGVVVFLGARLVERLTPAVRLFDAAGLGLFVVAGTAKALDAGLGALPAVVIGCLAGIGGGVLRDVLAGVVPIVLRREVYAVPALLGATVVVVADGLELSGPVVSVTAAALVFALRMIGVWRDWHAPVAPRWRRPPGPA
ncbi:MAG TPA: trimeric intracellular cation channel family protein [Mycobacteriales bacterium]|nr:trimeric intracellular cation channel family protein [Mycobacteriales bacterium]